MKGGIWKINLRQMKGENVILNIEDNQLLQLDKTLSIEKKFDVEDEIFKNLMFIHSMAIKELISKLEIIQEEFKVLYNYELINQITSRVKSPDSILKKMSHKDIDLTYRNLINNINDIAGIRIICTTKDDIFLIRDLISNLINVKILKEKDYVTYPKESGYSSYHVLVQIPVNIGREIVEVKVEIQIRTNIMDLWSNIEHDIKYKSNGNLSRKNF